MRGGIQAVWAEQTVAGCPQQVSADPAQVIPGAQLVLLALPAFAHEVVLQQIAPILSRGPGWGPSRRAVASTCAPGIRMPSCNLCHPTC